MNYNFTVQTPVEWKKELYENLNHKSRLRVKPIALIAALLAVVLCFSGTAFAGKVINAPEYFGSLFLGDTPQAAEVYSEKNISFLSSREDLQLTCVGIVGDSFRLHMLFHLTSSGDILFAQDHFYLFESVSESMSFLTLSYSRGMSCSVIDDRTLMIEVDLCGSKGMNMIGRKISISFDNLEKFAEGGDFSDKIIIPCQFSGEIRVDYMNTVHKMAATENTILIDGVSMRPLNAELSNMSLCFDMKIESGLEKIEDSQDFISSVQGEMLFELIDGTVISYDLQHPPKDENDISASSVSVVGKTASFNLVLPELISAAQIRSIYWNDIKVFVK